MEPKQEIKKAPISPKLILTLQLAAWVFLSYTSYQSRSYFIGTGMLLLALTAINEFYNRTKQLKFLTYLSWVMTIIAIVFCVIEIIKDFSK